MMTNSGITFTHPQNGFLFNLQKHWVNFSTAPFFPHLSGQHVTRVEMLKYVKTVQSRGIFPLTSTGQDFTPGRLKEEVLDISNNTQ